MNNKNEVKISYAKVWTCSVYFLFCYNLVGLILWPIELSINQTHHLHWTTLIQTYKMENERIRQLVSFNVLSLDSMFKLNSFLKTHFFYFAPWIRKEWWVWVLVWSMYSKSFKILCYLRKTPQSRLGLVQIRHNNNDYSKEMSKSGSKTIVLNF
jgi:hypothetical protein